MNGAGVLSSYTQLQIPDAPSYKSDFFTTLISSECNTIGLPVGTSCTKINLLIRLIVKLKLIKINKKHLMIQRIYHGVSVFSLVCSFAISLSFSFVPDPKLYPHTITNDINNVDTIILK